MALVTTPTQTWNQENGYLQKPIYANWIGIMFLALPILSFANTMISLDLSLPAAKPVVMTWIFIHHLLCSLAAAMSVIIISKPSYLLVIGISSYLFVLKIFQIVFLELKPNALDGMELLFCAAVIAGFLKTQIRIPYLHPEARLWKRQSRLAYAMRGILLSKGVKFPIVILDCSTGGAFVKLDERLFDKGKYLGHDRRKRYLPMNAIMTPDEFLAARKARDLYPKGIGEIISIQIQTFPSLDNPFKGKDIVVEAQVVWSTQVTDPYHFGLGLKFMGMNFQDKLKLKRYIHIIHRAIKCG